MTTHLSASGNRTRRTSLAAALVLAMLIGASTAPARAAGSTKAQRHGGTATASAGAAAPLYEGVGMGARPSVRVRRLQRTLVRRGFDVGPPGVDGRFGPLTAAAVRRMQARSGLTADAIVGPRTRRGLGLIVDRRRIERGETRQPGGAHRVTPHPGTDDPPAAAQRGPRRQPTTGARGPARRADTPSGLAVALLAVLLSAVALAIALLRRPRAPADRSDRGRAPAPAPLVTAREGAIGYVTLDGDGRVGRESLEKISAAAGDAGWLVQMLVYDEDVPGLFARPGLAYAIEQITGGRARALVVGDIKRLASSAGDLATLLDSCLNAGAVLVVPDLELDTATVEGRRAASAIITLGTSQQERPTQSPGSDRAAAPTLGTNGTAS
jgi:peptidoglycan hydrolase-like protein with peptidoglycan-binding domain